MKMIKRTFTLVLTLAVILAGFSFPAIQNEAIAETNTFTGIAGTSDVGIKPDDLLQSGEWLYYLDGDDAIIAGYKNIEERSIIIPYQLDNHHVVGISHNAFLNNYNLQNVQIHSLVNRIADDAFSTCETITVDAYSGAYALQFASEKRIRYNNLTNRNDHFTFTESVIDFSGFPSKQYTIIDDDRIQISLTLSKYLNNGNAIYIPQKSEEYSLFLYEIESKRDTEKSTIINLKDISSVDSLIERVVFKDEKLEMDVDNIIILNEGVVPDEVDSAIKFSNSSSKSKSFTVGIPLPGGAKVSGKISTAFSGSTSIDLLTFPHLSINSASVVYKENITNELTFSMKGEPTDSFKENHTVDLFEVPLISSAITIKLKVKLDISVTGSVTVKTEMSGTTTITKCNGKWDVKSNFEKKKPVVEAAIKGSIGVPIELSASLGFSIGKYGVELTFLQLTIKGSLDIEYKITTRLETPLKCRELTISFNITFTGAIGIVKLNVLGLFKGVEAKYEYSRKWTLLSIKAHFDDTGKGVKYVDSCKVADRDVVFKYQNGQPDYTIKADAGSRITDPGIPKKSGYIFDCWAFVTEEEGYVGPYLSRWDFDRYTLPYKHGTGSYVLMAHWILPGEEPLVESGQPEGEDGGTTGGGTWHPEPPKPVEVSSITLNKTNEILHVDGEYKDTLYLSAVVSPANAEDTSVSWTSSNEAVATVDGNGVVSAVAQGEATITCRSNMNPDIFDECAIHVYQPIYVTDIQLDKTCEELWANESDKNSLQLSATVIPADATYTSVHWSSSDENVAWVDGWGKVTGLSAGTATITCTSIKNQDVKATCQIIVHQHVRDVYVTSEKDGLLPGETAQLSALCYPTDSDNKNVSWTSNNEAVATVDATGVVTAHSYGEAIITATSADGGSVSGGRSVTVEHELALIGNVQNDELYLDGDNSVVIGYAFATQGSVRRMIERGYDLEWSLLNGETEVADAYYDVVSTTYTVDGQDYDMATAVLYNGELHNAGTATFTLQCKAGPYTATVDLSTTVVGDTLAKTVTLDPSTFDLEMDEIAHIPNAPIATDGGVIPRILSVAMSGDAYYRSHAHESNDEDGLCVWFPESGQYTANVIYKAANITYTVPVTFQVRDEDGIMRLPVTEVALNDSFVNLVVGDTHQLTTEVLPVDAYDRSVTWVSEDESIATVSQNGLVTAKARGMAYIRCEANDGSGCYDSCVINVEPFMALNETSIEKTIYMDGQTHATIDSCSLTYQSAIRIEEQGLTPNWKLHRVSGDATEIALNEFTAVADGNVRIEGEEIELLRAKHVGVDEYQLVCEAGEYSATCSIILTVVEGGKLPDSIALVTDSYEANVGETVTIDTSVICMPGTIELPEDVNITLEPSKAFWNAMEDGTYFADFNCTFAEAGEYTADLVYSGANYCYALPFIVRIKDVNGNVPVAIQDIVMSEDSAQLFVGESKQLSATVIPENASYGELEWSCFDTSIATVSEDGVVTAMDAGVTYVIASSPKSDHSAICLITVEDGLTLENETLTKTIFVDGTTRTTLEDVYLTEASSKRLNADPGWKLQRVSGNNLTLRVKECESASASGDVLYGCNIILYSVSAEGQTVYDLVCTSGSESATMRITVNAVNREGNIPASITLTPTSYEADVDELIVVNPEIICWPADTQLPVGTRVEYVGNKQFLEAINQEDWFVSQSISTFSFNEAGRYEASCVYSYSNISYTVPITFNIRDDQGEVPVHAVKMKLNTTSLQLVAGEESQLEAVFTPIDVTDGSVTWVSSDSSVATVSADGHVCALSNGTSEITCTPADTHCAAVTCYVTVEDYLTVETGSTSYTCYLEGEQVNDLSSAWLSEGTVMRLNRDGIKPTWMLNTTSGDGAVIAGTPEKDGSRILVATTSLSSAGTTEYMIQCTAGEQQWSQDYSVTVTEAGVQAPEEVTLATPEINLAVGETRTIDFAPVCLPAGTALPQKTTKAYAGIGGFYEARDRSVYAENGDNVTVAFTKPGRYLLARLYKARNLNYTALCVINVEAQSDAAFGLLRASETECTVYMDGKSGTVSDISFYDAMVYERYGNELEWTVERLSGDSVSLGLVPNEDSIKLFVADAEKSGTDVWRVSCGFGGITDYIDITVEAKEARKPIPTSIELSTQKITGVIGNWLYLPLGVKCIPDGSALPETGDAFWSFRMVGGLAEDVSSSKIENGSLAVCFSESGYYTGTLTYASGNVSYDLPIYFTISDEESQIATPDQLKVWLLADSTTVYPEGETGVSIATAVLAESLNSYYAGTTPSYVFDKGIEWSITMGASNALSLTIQPHTINTADIWLDAIAGTGDVQYSVSCIVDGKTYTGDGVLHIASDNEDRPDVTLKKTTYQVTQGIPTLISRIVYQRSNGSVLQSAGEWDVGSALAAIGYSYETTDDDWKVTFYKQGEYSTNVTTYVGNLRYNLPLTIKVVGKGEPEQLRTMKLPAALTVIEEEAFSGLTIQVIDMRGTRISSISCNAFKNCTDLLDVFIPDSVTSIDANAFYGCINLTIHCNAGSVTDTFASDHGFNVSYDMN